ncbi:O-antigen ligase family protein [Candidatus Uhrbacteria bacterium]|nr:O-antigen ligase family protein [Candidatus Uhrbacteria bacterium]
MIPSDNAAFRNAIRTSLVFLVFLETISFLGHLYPAFSTAAFVIILAATAIVAVIDFDLALLALLAELFIGSQGGYLVAYGAGGGGEISLRIGLFLVVSGIWNARAFVRTVRRGEERRKAKAPFAAMNRAGLMAPFAALNLVVLYGLIRGLALGNDFGTVFFDGNGYIFLGLMPIIVESLAAPLTRDRLAGVFVAAATLSVAKALFVLYVFSHRLQTIAPDLYVWIRDTRVGEITRMVGDFYRVFFQSHLYAVALFWIALLHGAFAHSSGKCRRLSLALLVMAATGLLMGMSRSFWFGAVVSALAVAAVLLRFRASAAVWKRLIALAIGSAVLGGAVIVAVFSVPFPRKGADISFAALFGDRAFSFISDDAAVSRWQLLPELNKAIARHPLLGSGLGTTVTYVTKDPRLLEQNPTGAYTTYAFEWGYHDLVVKFGLLGTVVYLWFIVAVMRPLLRAVRSSAASLAAPSNDEKTAQGALALGTVAAVIGMLATNIFSPYLNHPLGLGMLMIAAALGIHGAFSSDGSSSLAPTKPA